MSHTFTQRRPKKSFELDENFKVVLSFRQIKTNFLKHRRRSIRNSESSLEIWSTQTGVFNVFSMVCLSSPGLCLAVRLSPTEQNDSYSNKNPSNTKRSLTVRLAQLVNWGVLRLLGSRDLTGPGNEIIACRYAKHP